jgi:hypothetical protein
MIVITRILGHMFIFYWFGRFVPSIGTLTWTALWGHFASSFGGPVTKYFFVMQGAWIQILGVRFKIFSWWHPWEPKFKSGFRNSFWDFIVLTEYHEWLWKYMNDIWERVLAKYISPKLFAVKKKPPLHVWNCCKRSPSPRT